MKFASAVATALFLLSLFAAAQEGTPNQDCFTSSTHYTIAEASGHGESIELDDFTDRWRAFSYAADEVNLQLAIHSGVVCEICWDGIQCRRYVTVLGGYEEEFEEIPGDTEEEAGWSCTLTFSGGYVVTCHWCPLEF